jgi:lysine biosynthesis protein LysW
MQNEKLECIGCGFEKALTGVPEQGEIFTCECCGTLLEVLSQTPLKFGKAPQIEEDFGE